MTYAFRTAPPQLTLSSSEAFDLELRGAFEAIHRDLHKDAWLCATPPFTLGGLGLTLTTTISSLSYYSSLLSTFSLVRATIPASMEGRLMTAVAASHAHFSSEVSLPLHLQLPAALASLRRDGYILGTQSSLSALCHHSRLRSYLSLPSGLEIPSRRLAHNLTCRTQSSQFPFTEHPEPKSCTKIDPEVWIMMIQLRLGNPVFNGTQPCPRCTLSRSVSPPWLDPLGVHATTCPSLEGYVRRHNHLRDKLITNLRHPSIGLRPSKEFMFPCETDLPPYERHRMDILIDDLELSLRPQAIDLFIVSPYTTRALPASTKHLGGATVGIEDQKTR